MQPQRANIPLQGLDRCTRAISGPNSQIALEASFAPFHQSWFYMVSKKHSGKADQLTSVRGGSEHVELFSVAISWGNKMNFSLCVNMSSFCSDSNNCECMKWSWWVHTLSQVIRTLLLAILTSSYKIDQC